MSNTNWAAKFGADTSGFGTKESDIPTGYHTVATVQPADVQEWAKLILNSSATTYGDVYSNDLNGEKLYARVEHHTWTYRNGQLVTGNFKGVTVYLPIDSHITGSGHVGPVGSAGTDTALPSGLSASFFTGLVGLALKYKINPLDLLSVMAFESGVKPTALNPSSHAVGLIQFMPATLRGMGYKGDYTTFRNLSAEEQIPYVERYFAPYAKHGLDSAGRVYQAVFLPASLTYASKGSDVVASHAVHPEAYNANRGFDTAGKGSITVDDLTNATLRAKKALGARWLQIEKAVRAANLGLSPAKKVAISGVIAAGAGLITKLLGWW